MRISFGNRISAQSWDYALAELALQERFRPGSQSGAQPLEIDLSAVGFADFMILGRILILVAGTASSGGTVTVIPPASALLPQEEALLARHTSTDAGSGSRQQTAIAQRRRQRLACRLFMRQAGFLSALEHGPWPNNRVTVKEAATLPESEGPTPELTEDDLEDLTPARPPLRQRRLVPYRWLPARSSDSESETKALESEMLALGLDAEDCAVLAHVVAEELIQNVRDHAAPADGNPRAPLVGLVVLQAKAYNSRVDDFDSSLHDMLSSAAPLNSQLVRLFVGDAGRGIGQGGPTENQAAIFHAMDTWTSSPKDHLPIRGLWKLHQVTQSYSGSLILSSEGAVAGYVFDHAASSRRVSAVMPYQMPGTIAECSMPMLTGRLRPLQHVELPSRTLGSGIPQTLRLRPVSVAFQPPYGIDPENLDQVRRALSELSPADGLVIAAEVPTERRHPDKTDLAAFIRDVLDLGARAAEVAPVGIVFSGINRAWLDVNIANFNQRATAVPVDTAESSLSNTFLVLAEENLQYWMAGPPTIREVFNKLARMDASLPIDRLTRDNRLIQHIRAQHGLRLDWPVVSLRLRPQDVISALSRHFAGKLRDAVARAELNGVEEGAFLTPGLRFTSRWINVEQLLTSLNCTSTVAFLLAFATRDRVGMYLRPGVSVLRVGSISRDLVTVFALSLTGSGKYYDAAPDIPAYTDKQHTAEPAAVIICTDLVSTAQAVKMAAREIVAYGGKPIAIASILDGRDYGTEEDAEHIRVDDLQVPFIAMTDVPISAQERTAESEFEPIDPIIGEPVSRVPVRARSRISQGTYIAALERTSAARLGHIERPGRRHYTAFVDPTLLFRDHDWAAEAMKLMVNRIRAARRTLNLTEPETCPVVIMYPSKTRDNIREVVGMLSDTLDVAGIPVDSTIHVPRAVFGGRWTFPAAITLPQRPFHAVLIDPVCRSGQTTRQLIRLAAVPQVCSITSFILLNGLSEAEALALHQQTSVDPIDPRNGRQVQGRAVPLSVTFLARTAVMRVSSDHCPICTLRRAYADLPIAMPKPLVDQQELLLTALEPQSKDTVFENSTPLDHLGAPIEQSDCVAYLTWRARLSDAVYSTRKRKEVVDEIRPYLAGQLAHQPGTGDGAADAQNSPEMALMTDSHALIRLLAMEGNWLLSAPLVFDENAASVARVAASLIGSPRRTELDAMLRCQATMVLATADAWRFAQNLPRIVYDSADHHQVCCQVLLEVVRILESPRTPKRVTEKIIEGLLALEDPSGSTRAVPYIAPEIRLPQQVRFLSSIARRKLIDPPNSRLAAWSALRGRYLASVRRHAYDEPVWRLLLRLRNMDSGLQPSDPHGAVNDWLVCSDELAAEALVNLPSLAPILLSKRVTAQLSNSDMALWHDVVAGRGQELLDGISLRVQRIFFPDGGSPDEDKGADIAEHVEWWNKLFFSAPSDGVSPRRDAVLVRLLDECPSPLLGVLEECFHDSSYEIRWDIPADTAVHVFCTNSLLSDLFMHIRRNAEYRRIADAEQKFEISISGDSPDYLRIIVRNSGSDPSTNPGGGQGLTNLADDLERFEGEFVDTAAVSPMTYAVGIRVRRWRSSW